jgi:hypothetical protein
MTEEQDIAPADQVAWYRTYWQELGTKFLFGFFAGLALLGAAFLGALYFVIRAAALAAMNAYAGQFLR